MEQSQVIPPSPTSSTPAGNTEGYNFILNPDKKKAGGLLKDPFITKIIFLVGGAVVLMIVVAVVINLVTGSKTNVETFVALAQRQQEIVRIGALDDDATSQEIKNAAISTEVSVQSQQNKLLAYLKTHKRTVAPADLALKKDASIDTKLKQAKEAGTFDTTYASIMRAQLTAYSSALKSAYNNESSSTQRQVLAQQYYDAQLLLKSWPEDSTTE